MVFQREETGKIVAPESNSAASLIASEFGKISKDVKIDSTENMLTIVVSQRNRLKVRVKEMENEVAEEKKHSAFLQSELDKAHSDNVQLYGKIRFLQNYQMKQVSF